MIHRRIFGLPPGATDSDIAAGADVPSGAELHRLGDTLVVLSPEFATSITAANPKSADLTVADASDFAAGQAARLYDGGVLVEKVSILSVAGAVVTLRRAPVHADLTSKALELRREWILRASWDQLGDDWINDDGSELEPVADPHPADVAKAAVAAGETVLVVVGRASPDRVLTPPEAVPVVQVPKDQWDAIAASKDPAVVAAVAVVDADVKVVKGGDIAAPMKAL